MDSLYEVSQINEVNREGASQILGKYYSYKKKNSLKDGENLVLDELENILKKLYNTAFQAKTIKEAESNEIQLNLLHKIINNLNKKN